MKIKISNKHVKKETDFSDRILVGLTGSKDHPWENKLREINKFKIPRVALFVECFEKPERQRIYEALLSSEIKEIPLVHIRNDTDKEELSFLAENFDSSYFTIHEEGFEFLKRWWGYYQHLFLEMNYDNFVSSSVAVGKIGGFCVDLSHFKADEEKWSKEFEYTIERRRTRRYFACNHLNGYSYDKNIDLHTIKSLKDFDYLKTLPKFLFGDVIALETWNSISQQLEYKEYLVKLLNENFNE